MTPVLFFSLKILHVAAVTVWMGGSLTVPSDIRRSLTLGPPHSAELMPRLRRVARMMNLSAFVTLVTGLGLVLAAGGFATVPHRIHLGLGLTLLAVVVGRWLIRPVIHRIAELSRGASSAEDVDRVLRRFWAGNGLEHLLRAAVLVLMVYPFTF